MKDEEAVRQMRFILQAGIGRGKNLERKGAIDALSWVLDEYGPRVSAVPLTRIPPADQSQKPEQD